MAVRWILGAGIVTAVALVVVFLAVPTPLVALQPGPTFDVLGAPNGQPTLALPGSPTFPTTGQLRMTTVAVSDDLTAGTALSRWVGGHPVVPRDSVYEPTSTPEETDAHNRAQFAQSETDAASAAAAFLRRPVPAARFRIDDVGGPSAGLVFALGIVDQLTPGDLLAGRTVAGTGTIDARGQVGMVGGLAEKLPGARAAGATLFLVPAAECDEARDAAPDGLVLARVSSLPEAVAAITAVREGRSPAVC